MLANVSLTNSMTPATFPVYFSVNHQCLFRSARVRIKREIRRPGNETEVKQKGICSFIIKTFQIIEKSYGFTLDLARPQRKTDPPR